MRQRTRRGLLLSTSTLTSGLSGYDNSSSSRRPREHATSTNRPAMAVVSPSRDQPPKKRSLSVLGSLREAINKVRFLLSSSATRWMLLSSLARGGAGPVIAPTPRRLSFDARPGLLDVDGGSILQSPSPTGSSRSTSRSASLGTATSRSVSRTSSSASSPPSEVLTRTSSAGSASPPASWDDDIDRRAEEFIRNFYRQLQMERQVSLQLRYVRGNSFDRTP